MDLGGWLTSARFPVTGSEVASREFNDGGGVGALGGAGLHDEIRRSAVNSRAWSMSSFASNGEAERWLEMARYRCASGLDAEIDLLQDLDKKMVSEGALEHGEERETKRRWQDHLEASESSTHGGSDAELR
jgi:hypothetical protein